MATPIATKSLGINSFTGLEDRLNVWQLTIDAFSELVTIVYQIETLSPTGVVVARSNNQTYTRYNRAEYTDGNGEIVPANNKFDILRASDVGQMITGLINIDLNLIQSIETLITDLMQN